MAITQTTELEAINTMLSVIGESPVQTLVDTGLADVEMALQILGEQSRAVQSKGWHFNTEVDYTLSPSVDGYLLPPPSTLRGDTTKEYHDYDVSMRGDKLYNKKDHTFVFVAPIKVDLVVGLDFTDLPEAARFYITTKASRVFQRRILGAESIERFTEQDEMSALSVLMDAEGDTADHNVLCDSYSAASILQR